MHRPGSKVRRRRLSASSSLAVAVAFRGLMDPQFQDSFGILWDDGTVGCIENEVSQVNGYQTLTSSSLMARFVVTRIVTRLTDEESPIAAGGRCVWVCRVCTVCRVCMAPHQYVTFQMDNNAD